MGSKSQDASCLIVGAGCLSLGTLLAKRFKGAIQLSMEARPHHADNPLKAEAAGREASTIAAILAGQTQLFHELVRPHERSVYLIALSYMKNEADAEDVAQEAFLKAFRNLASFRAESKFGTWLISITLNEARNRLRRNAAVPMDSMDATPEEGGTVSPALLRDWREVPSEAIERAEVKQMLQRAVENLPEIYRCVFVLRDVEELSVNETASALSISVPSVKVRLHRARILLQKHLAPELKSVSKTKRRWFPWS